MVIYTDCITEAANPNGEEYGNDRFAKNVLQGIDMSAKQMIDHAGLKYIQIDAGRIGGITVSKDVADYAEARGVTYVNHTFTSNLALSASLQPYAGLKSHLIFSSP